MTLLALIRAHGYSVRLDGARFLVSPADRLTPDDRARLAEWREEILEELRQEEIAQLPTTEQLQH